MKAKYLKNDTKYMVLGDRLNEKNIINELRIDRLQNRNE